LVHRITRNIGGKEITLETGLLGKQASGSVVACCGGTKVFAAATYNPDVAPEQDFFPLTVDYREMTYASGKIPGSFFRREGRPTEREVLVSRLIDRPVRPLFPEGFMNEVSIMALAISFDQENETDVLAQVAAGAALAISEIPVERIIGSVRVGHIDGEFVINPLASQFEESALNLIVSGSKEGVCMVEAGANEVSEDMLHEAIEFGHRHIVEVVSLIEELVALAGKPKLKVEKPELPPFYARLAEQYRDRIMEAGSVPTKLARRSALRAVKKDALENFRDEDGTEIDPFQLKKAYEKLEHDVLREKTLTGVRCDGRRYDEIRPISIEVGYLPGAHGSAIFTRGETQSLSTCTLGTFSDEILIDGIIETYYDRFMLHYNFPSFSVGETYPNRGPRRREIGHGALAKRALRPLLPPEEEFPYTIRIVSDIMESNGSSSMATVCGGSLAMMDAGVPIKEAVAGIAMGLLKKDDGEFVILSDILGDEDHFGDMDFKVAGTKNGVTALQMDIKITGIPTEVMARALAQAREGRLHILERMNAAISEPRKELAPNAPRIHMIKIPVEMIGKLIGPGGKTIRSIQDETKSKIDIEDDGTVTIAAVGEDNLQNAVRRVEEMTMVPEEGQLLEGTVIDVRDFGLIMKLGPEVEGMCHVSEIAEGYVRDVSQFFKKGDKFLVKVISVGDDGKIRLSRRQAFEEQGLPDPIQERLRQEEMTRPDRSNSSHGRGRGQSHQSRSSGRHGGGNRSRRGKR